MSKRNESKKAKAAQMKAEAAQAFDEELGMASSTTTFNEISAMKIVCPRLQEVLDVLETAP